MDLNTRQEHFKYAREYRMKNEASYLPSFATTKGSGLINPLEDIETLRMCGVKIPKPGEAPKDESNVFYITSPTRYYNMYELDQNNSNVGDK